MMQDTRQSESQTVTLRCQFCLKLNRIDVGRAAERPKCGECGKPMLLDRPIKISEEDFDRLVSEAEIPVLVDFYADWCGPCRIMAPLLDDLARERLGEVLVAKLDTDRYPGPSRILGIRGIPTLILFRDGVEVGREVGAVPKDRLEALIETAS